MAIQQSVPAGSSPSAQVIGNAFVQQFFHILHHSPEHVHRFYQENSKLGRPSAKDEMSMVSTLQGIDEKIQSMDYTEYRAQIKTVDAQESLGGGVIVLVTGYLIGKDDLKRDFTQTFFLATQDKGFTNETDALHYYVLNDMFRFVEDVDQQEQGFTNETDAPLSTEQGSIPSQEEHIPEQTESVTEENEVNEDEVYDPSEHDESSTVDDDDKPVEEVIDEVPNGSLAAVAEPGPSIGQEQKKSYASIVRVMKENSTPISYPTLAPARVAPINTEQQVVANESSLAPVSEASEAGSGVADISIVQELEADGYSIYIKNLPLNATPAQLEEEFKKFGPIKPNGIQVRSNKLQGFCFGFVEFEVASAVQNAIEDSPIMVGGRQAYVEEKRTTGSRVNSRGRFPPGRGGGFRSDGMRGRGSYGAGRVYGRGDYNNRADFGIRGGGRSGTSVRGDVGYQRVDHMSSNAGRGNRSRSPSVSTSQGSDTARMPAPAENQN